LYKEGGDVCGTVAVEPGCNIDVLPFGGETFDAGKLKLEMVKQVKKAGSIVPSKIFNVAGRMFYLG